MNIYLLRHGEVENPKNVLYGRLPGFHLSKFGREHVRRTAQKLIGKGIEKIYSSPLERAVETSTIVLEELGLDDKDLIIDERLIESDLTKWQGTSLEEYKKKVVFKLSPKTQKEFEPIVHAGERVLSVINGPILERGKNALAVSHGDPLVGALIDITNDWSFVEVDTLEKKYIKKGEFVVISRFEGSWEITDQSY